jgi:hypothetical protein
MTKQALGHYSPRHENPPTWHLNFSFDLNQIQNQFQPNSRGITHLQLSYLRILKFTCNFWRTVQMNRGTCHGPRTGTRRCDVARARAFHASPPRLRCASPYHGRALKSGRALGVRRPHTHLQGSPRLVSPRATQRARACRGAVGLPTAHACLGRARRPPPAIAAATSVSSHLR